MFSDSPSTSLKRKTMSLTQTYYLAHTARGKLSAEAARADHNLRLLVGHANLLDSLMLDLASAEQEQESWFNKSVQSATKSEESPREHIQWADAIVEDPEEDWDAEDADSSDSDDSDYDEDEDAEMQDATFTTLYRTSSHSAASATVREIEDDDEFEDDGEEDYASLSLTPSPSHSTSPPELLHDSDSESEDDSMPPSPPSTSLPSFSEKQQIATTSFYSSSNPQSLSPSEQSSFLNEGFFIPPRPSPNLVNAISVY